MFRRFPAQKDHKIHDCASSEAIVLYSHSTMMKLLTTAVVSALLAGNAVAFAPCPATSIKKQSSLHASTVNGVPNDGYSNKPLFERKSTTPIADRKVSWIQRQTLPDAMIDPNYFLTFAVAILGPLIWWYHPCKFLRNTAVSKQGYRYY